MQDIKIRYALYLSDLRDGLDGQVAAAAIFIFFAALSAAITFGGMYGKIQYSIVYPFLLNISVTRTELDAVLIKIKI